VLPDSSGEHFAAEFTRWCLKPTGSGHQIRSLAASGLQRRLRKQTGSTSAKQWAFDLIERDQCGYRLSVHPLRLHLDIVLPRPLKIPAVELKKKSFAIFFERHPSRLTP